MSERTFRRWRDRYAAEGAPGLFDRRLGQASARRVAADRVDAMLTLYREHYGGFTARHFHDKLVRRHGFTLGYTWTKLRLQEAALPQPRAPDPAEPAARTLRKSAGAGARLSGRALAVFHGPRCLARYDGAGCLLDAHLLAA